MILLSEREAHGQLHRAKLYCRVQFVNLSLGRLMGVEEISGAKFIGSCF